MKVNGCSFKLSSSKCEKVTAKLKKWSAYLGKQIFKLQLTIYHDHMLNFLIQYFVKDVNFRMRSHEFNYTIFNSYVRY